MERLQKILAHAGIGSRRQCEELIKQGRVSVDGEVVKNLGATADIEKQKIYCDGELVHLEKKRYYLFYKPKNCLCTNAESQTLRVIDFFKGSPHRLYTIGRLDKDTEGLILVTNDGDTAQKFAHPSYQLEKVYRIVAKNCMDQETIKKIKKGVWISEGKIHPKRVHLVTATNKISIVELTLTEGKNRVVRRIFAQIGHPVIELLRIRIGNFEIDDLAPGKYRIVTEKEIQKALSEMKKDESKKGKNIKSTKNRHKPKKQNVKLKNKIHNPKKQGVKSKNKIHNYNRAKGKGR